MSATTERLSRARPEHLCGVLLARPNGRTIMPAYPRFQQPATKFLGKLGIQRWEKYVWLPLLRPWEHVILILKESSTDIIIRLKFTKSRANPVQESTALPIKRKRRMLVERPHERSRCYEFAFNRKNKIDLAGYIMFIHQWYIMAIHPWKRLAEQDMKFSRWRGKRVLRILQKGRSHKAFQERNSYSIRDPLFGRYYQARYSA